MVFDGVTLIVFDVFDSDSIDRDAPGGMRQSFSVAPLKMHARQCPKVRRNPYTRIAITY